MTTDDLLSSARLAAWHYRAEVLRNGGAVHIPEPRPRPPARRVDMFRGLSVADLSPADLRSLHAL